MSAAEIIELIKELPENEIEQVEAYLLHRSDTGGEARRKLSPDTRKSLIKNIFREHEEDFCLLAQ